MIHVRRAREKKFISEINITPFTDVCLVLLIIFMVTATALTGESSLLLKLPRAASADVSMPASVTVRITHAGEVYLNQDRVSFETLQARLGAYHEEYGTKLLVVKADEGIPYRMVIQTIDYARLVGINQFALATRRVGPVMPPQAP